MSPSNSINQNEYLWDVFISHATEDKDVLARPLAGELRSLGVRVWIDEQELKIGDSLRRKIDQGLRQSKFGVVILSKAFFGKEWPQKELDALVAREGSGEKVILPVWHDVTFAEVQQRSLLLADRKAALSSKPIKTLAQEIAGVVAPSRLTVTISTANTRLIEPSQMQKALMAMVRRERGLKARGAESMRCPVCSGRRVPALSTPQILPDGTEHWDIMCMDCDEKGLRRQFHRFPAPDLQEPCPDWCKFHNKFPA
jgi:hypothetical protein